MAAAWVTTPPGEGERERPGAGALRRGPLFFRKRGTRPPGREQDYGRISVNFYYFENESKGIAVGLGNIQKRKDGEALGGTRTTADDDFGDLEDGFED